MNLIKTYIIEKEIKLIKYIDIENDQVIRIIYNNLIHYALNNMVYIEVKKSIIDYFRKEYIPFFMVNRYMFQVSKKDTTKSNNNFTYAKDVIFSLIISGLNYKEVERLVDTSIKGNNRISLCIDNKGMAITSYDDNNKVHYESHTPKIITKIKTDLIKIHNDLINKFEGLYNEELICLIYNIIVVLLK